jgi:hypothetical protein
MVFIRTKTIKSITIRWDIPSEEDLSYIDNFKVSSKEGDVLLVPSIIIKMRNVKSPITFDTDSDENPSLLINEDILSQKPFLRRGFIPIIDENGETNYIPVCNIECIELKREFVYPDEIWAELQKTRDLDDRQN